MWATVGGEGGVLSINASSLHNVSCGGLVQGRHQEVGGGWCVSESHMQQCVCERETDRQTQRERDGDRDRDTERQREGQREHVYKG